MTTSIPADKELVIVNTRCALGRGSLEFTRTERNEGHAFHEVFRQNGFELTATFRASVYTDK